MNLTEGSEAIAVREEQLYKSFPIPSGTWLFFPSDNTYGQYIDSTSIYPRYCVSPASQLQQNPPSGISVI